MKKAERSVSKQGHLACIHGQVTKHTTVKWPIITHAYTAIALFAVAVKLCLIKLPN